MDINYFAAARAAASTAHEDLALASLGLGEEPRLAALRQYLGERHTGSTPSGMTMAQVLEQCSFLVNGESAAENRVLRDSDRIDVLPPFAGG